MLCEITLSVNAVGEPGPKSIAALDGLGEIAFRGSILPEHAVTILQIIEGTLRADVDGAGDAGESTRYFSSAAEVEAV